MLARKRQQWNAGLMNETHDIQRRIIDARSAMGDLQGIKKAIKGEVTEIIDSNFKEF